MSSKPRDPAHKLVRLLDRHAAREVCILTVTCAKQVMVRGYVGFGIDLSPEHNASLAPGPFHHLY